MAPGNKRRGGFCYLCVYIYIYTRITEHREFVSPNSTKTRNKKKGSEKKKHTHTKRKTGALTDKKKRREKGGSNYHCSLRLSFQKGSKQQKNFAYTSLCVSCDSNAREQVTKGNKKKEDADGTHTHGCRTHLCIPTPPSASFVPSETLPVLACCFRAPSPHVPPLSFVFYV